MAVDQFRLPAEERLNELAARFSEAERRVRALIRKAPDGDRRRLLSEALAILLELRRDAQGAGEHVEHAYLVAAKAIGALTGKPTPDGAAGRDLGARLAANLDRAVLRAEQGARDAFATATEDNLAEAEQEAVSAREDALGRRYALGATAALLTATSGRHAVSRAVRATLAGDPATVHVRPVADSGCHAAAGAGEWPPYHVHCVCTPTPSGFTVEDLGDAMAATA